jgi:predicted CoA-substrate-specific enzyme activase
MITAGVDCGAKNVKVVILKDGKIAGRAMAAAGIDAGSAAEKAFDEALKSAGCDRSSVNKVVSTGTGKNEPKFKNDIVTEVGADAKGIHFVNPKIRTVIDIGAEEGRAIRVDENGKVVDFAINEKCAAGAGAFTEAMARALEMPLEDFGAFSLKSTQDVPMNAQCAVFAESEVVSLVHRKIPKQDIARAIHNAIADRITSMVRMVGITPDVALIGGVSKNVGFVASLKEDLQVDLFIPEERDFIGAIGAACVAADSK